MSNQITKAMLQSYVDGINREVGAPAEPYTRQGKELVTNIGCHYIESAYGGFNLFKISNSGGGVFCPFGSGYMTKRELYGKLQAYYMGLAFEKNA